MFRDEFRHLKQPNTWGCMYYAAQYFVEGDFREEWLYDVNHHNFARNMEAIGHPIFFYYIDDLIMTPATRQHWMAFKPNIDKFPDNNYIPLLIDIHSTVMKGEQHRVAVELRKEQIIVSDPGKYDIQRFTWEEFLESPYAQALSIIQICEDNEKFFPVDDARTRVREPIIHEAIADLHESLT